MNTVGYAKDHSYTNRGFSMALANLSQLQTKSYYYFQQHIVNPII